MKKLPPLIELRAFEAAARRLSFKDAAADLGVTPTAISHQIPAARTLLRASALPPSTATASIDGGGSSPLSRCSRWARGVCHRHRRCEAGRGDAAASGDHNECLCQPLARAPPAALEEGATGNPIEVIGTDAVLDLRAGDADVSIRYTHAAPTASAKELLRDAFWPVCHRQLLSTGRPLKRAADLRRHVLIHCDWPRSDAQAPTWQRWLAAARGKWCDVPEFHEMGHLSFREELHAIEAVIAAQGIGICSDVLVADKLISGTLVKALDMKLPGYGFYLVHMPGHPRQKMIDAFSAWLQSVR